MQLVIAEKPSVARSIADVIGARDKKNGYLEGNGFIVSWCIGHLVELAQPDAYGEKYRKWSYDNLPIIPTTWKYMIENLPHKVMEDLAVIYQISLGGDENGTATVNVSNQLLERYGIDNDELHDIAVQNTAELRPVSFRSMQEVIMEMMGASEMAGMGMDSDMSGGMPMYVLTNEDKMHGAAAMLYPNLMDEIAEKVGGDFFVLHSSLHELLIIPKGSGVERAELENMVQEVNATQVAPDEVLSDHVYEYDAKEHELFRSDKAEERQEQKEVEKVKILDRGKEEKPKEKESLKQKLPEMKAKAEAFNQTKDKGRGLKKEAEL